MGNAKSRNNTEQIVETEFSRILSSNKELPTTTTRGRKWKAIEDNQATTTITSAAITVGGPLSVEVKNNKTTENSNKTIKASQLLQVDQKQQQQQCNKQRQQKAADSSANSAAAEQQRLKQVTSLFICFSFFIFFIYFFFDKFFQLLLFLFVLYVEKKATKLGCIFF